MRLVKCNIDVGTIIAAHGNALQKLNIHNHWQLLDRRHAGEARLGIATSSTQRFILVSNIAQKCIEPRIKNACLNSAPIE